MEIKEFSDRFKSLDNIVQLANNAMVAGLYEIKAQMLSRIFNENIDINGVSFGTYKSEAYKQYRQSLGRQVSAKDL